MQEKLYTLNEDGSVSGLEYRDIVHKTGILHATVQCWIRNAKGEVLLQRRSFTKAVGAGKWDVSFGGHCSETSEADYIIANVLKEGEEELGIKINPQHLLKLGEFRHISQQNKNQEIITVFLLPAEDFPTYSFNDGEVSEIKWIRSEDLYQTFMQDTVNYSNRLGAIRLLELYDYGLNRNKNR